MKKSKFSKRFEMELIIWEALGWSREETDLLYDCEVEFMFREVLRMLK